MEQGKLFTMTERLEPCYDDPPVNEAIYYTGWQILEKFTGYVAIQIENSPVDEAVSSIADTCRTPIVAEVIEFPNKELGKTAMSDMRSGKW